MFLPFTTSHLQVYIYIYIYIYIYNNNNKFKSLHNIGYKNKWNLNYVEYIAQYTDRVEGTCVLWFLHYYFKSRKYLIGVSLDVSVYVDLKVVWYEMSDHIVFAPYELYEGNFVDFRKVCSVDCTMPFVYLEVQIPILFLNLRAVTCA